MKRQVSVWVRLAAIAALVGVPLDTLLTMDARDVCRALEKGRWS